MGFFNWNEKPPTIKAILESIVNYNNDNPVGLSHLAGLGHDKIFSFDYDLDESLFSKESFEINILNNFMERRIGFETIGAFKLKLQVKILEIIPQVNMMIKTYSELLNQGLINKTIRTKSESNLYSKDTTGNSETNSELENSFSDTPQNRINDIKSGSYASDFTYNKSINESNTSVEDLSSDDLSLREEVEKINGDEVLKSIKTLSKETKNIFTLVYDELEPLFYNLV